MTSTLRTAYAVWVVGLLVYLVAVFHRSSLAVAGLAATERFDISASQLATFTMLQLLVYAGMQIPVGLLVDRFGSRSVLLCGTVAAHPGPGRVRAGATYSLALLARVFVGMGDAMTFICVLRLVSSWFPTRRIPLVTQLTGTLGQLGAVVAAVPMTWALEQPRLDPRLPARRLARRGPRGRVLVVLRDAPGVKHLRGPALSLAGGAHQPGGVLGAPRHPARLLDALLDPVQRDRAGLLWGYPFFVRGEGLSPATAGALLTLMVVAVMCAGPVLGWLVGAHPWHRSTMVLTIVSTIVVVWTVGPGLARRRAALAAGRARRRGRRRWPGVDDRLRPRAHVEPRGAVRERQRDHQPGRLPGRADPGDRDRADPRLAHARATARRTRPRRSAGR